MKKILLAITFLIAMLVIAKSQSFNIGIRAGLNYSTFNGPLEQGETMGFSSGFHFGINYQRNLVDNFGVRLELLYIQNGAIQRYGDSDNFTDFPTYYIIRWNGVTTFEEGFAREFLLDVSNAYISLPITAHFKPFKKWEFVAGAYMNFLIGPTANGKLDFISKDDPERLFFIQTLIYNYYSDEVLQSPSTQTIGVWRGDDPVDLPRVAAAYYQYTSSDINGSNYNKFDMGLIAGVSYYFNKGLYLGLRGSFGLLDLTNDFNDFSLRDFNGDKTLIRREDKDTHFGIEGSIGFKF